MKSFFLTATTVLWVATSLFAQEKDLFDLFGTKVVNDSAFIMTAAEPGKKRSPVSQLVLLLQNKEAGKLTLCLTKEGNTVEAYFFPGRSDKKAVIVGGMHGSELPSIEVAHTLIKNLSAGEKPYYNVVVIPSLFPDNAETAREDKGDRVVHNTGRYTNEKTADPNRQMPLPGKAFTSDHPFDALDREIEEENQVLLTLIQHYRPDRLLSIHSIKDRNKAGVFADPRTDCMGNALGFETDQALALLMAQHIEANGGTCPGNNLGTEPSAVYYLDPPVVQAGFKQVRNYEASTLKGRGRGISMGTWCSTAVCDGTATEIRAAIRTFTLEFPGNLLPSEYANADEQQKTAKMIGFYAASVQHYFLQSFFSEEEGPERNLRFASN